jgi:quercetin dioxygenase-like cupin family protein
MDLEVVESLKIVALIKYQEDSIVSKTMLNKKTGSVTLFAFDKGQKLSEHTTPFDALIFLLDGEAEIIISDKPYLVKEGELIKLPANKPHALNAQKRFKMILIMIKP